MASGHIRFQQIDPAELSPGEFAATVRSNVERDKAKLIVIDSLNGYLNAMPDERFLVLQMHELLTYLAQQGVLTILILAQHGLIGPMQTPVDLSYLADAVLMLRYFEVGGTVRRALSVGRQEAQRQSREYDPRIPPQLARDSPRSTAHRFQRDILRNTTTARRVRLARKHGQLGLPRAQAPIRSACVSGGTRTFGC